MVTTSPLINPAAGGIRRLMDVVVEVDGDSNRQLTQFLPGLRLAHPNVLIVGAASDTERALERIRPALRSPLVTWSPTESRRIPADAFRTLIVRDVECLTPAQQASLAALLDQEDCDAQVVSIAGLPLFPLVTQGGFLNNLYYRLNVLLFELGNR